MRIILLKQEQESPQIDTFSDTISSLKGKIDEILKRGAEERIKELEEIKRKYARTDPLAIALYSAGMINIRAKALVAILKRKGLYARIPEWQRQAIENLGELDRNTLDALLGRLQEVFGVEKSEIEAEIGKEETQIFNQVKSHIKQIPSKYKIDLGYNYGTGVAYLIFGDEQELFNIFFSLVDDVDFFIRACKKSLPLDDEDREWLGRIEGAKKNILRLWEKLASDTDFESRIDFLSDNVSELGKWLNIIDDSVRFLARKYGEKLYGEWA